MKVDLTIPSKLSEIKLKDYQKYMIFADNNKEDHDALNLKAVEIFCRIRFKKLQTLKLKDFEDVLEILSATLEQPKEFKQRFKLAGKTFGFIPKLDDISMGEYIDLSNYMTSIEDLHKAMAVMYRPITTTAKDMYLIEDYEGSDKYADLMKEAPLDVVLGAQVFFLQFKQRIVDTYSGIFREGGNEEYTSEANFGRKWGWYSSLYALAQGDVSRFENIAELNLHKCLTWLEFEKEKNELEAKRIKR